MKLGSVIYFSKLYALPSKNIYQGCGTAVNPSLILISLDKSSLEVVDSH
uniref:Uncharacterized protein n=1 Tax=Rhizophora mucronata TaxID=61149 RepID=A0A2P2NMC9_RHIMU